MPAMTWSDDNNRWERTELPTYTYATLADAEAACQRGEITADDMDEIEEAWTAEGDAGEEENDNRTADEGSARNQWCAEAIEFARQIENDLEA